MDRLSRDLQDQQRHRKRLDADIDKLDGQIKNERLQSIQMLALFVAFFTFVSVQFQLFSFVKDVFLFVSLSMVLLGALLIFVCLTHLGVEYYKESPSKLWAWVAGAFKHGLFYVGIFAIALFVTGVVLASTGNSNLNSRRKNQRLACDKLNAQVITAINHSSKAVHFLENRYNNECKNIWAGS